MNEFLVLPMLAINRQDLVVGLSLLIVGIVLTIIFLGLHWWFKTQKDKNNFNRRKQESQSIWDFTKKNFFIFCALFFLIMAITGITILLK